MQMLGWILFGTAMILVVLHRDRAKAYLAAFEARYGVRPGGGDWLRHADPDPAVEALRRRRLLFAIPASVCVLGGTLLLAFRPA